jgi:hypothetical protein
VFDGRRYRLVTNYLKMSNENHPYIELRRQMHDALREQHPEWVEPNGNSPICESYELRFVELLGLSLSGERKSVA